MKKLKNLGRIQYYYKNLSPSINLLRMPKKREVFESLLPFFVIFELSNCKICGKKFSPQISQIDAEIK